MIKPFQTALIIALMIPSLSYAENELFVDYGLVEKPSAWILQLGVQSGWDWTYPVGEEVVLGGSWLFAFECGHWSGQEDGESVSVGLHAMPVLQLKWKKILFEAGFGVHLLSNPEGSGRLSTAFEFGEMVGVNIPIYSEISIGYILIHISNGGIKKPNSGINAHLLHFKYAF